MSNNEMSIEELRRREDVEALLSQVKWQMKSQYVASKELTDSGIPLYIAEQLVEEAVEPVGSNMRRKWQEMHASMRSFKPDASPPDDLEKLHLHQVLKQILTYVHVALLALLIILYLRYSN